ncbi:MAG: amidase family protein [Chryseolinea sp.]
MPITKNVAIRGLSAVELLNRIDKGELASREVTQYFIDEIERVNPSLNAVVIKLFDDALKQADKADELFKQGKRTGRLHGLPFTIKECLDFQGTPSTLGVIRRKKDIRSNTDDYIRALQQEGGIVLGKTNVAQLLSYFECNNPVYGTTNNPHNILHTSGGSSGGEGAIVGAGASPVGIGTDIGGSVRIPAAFCGTCSIKPTMSRTVDQTRFIDRHIDLSINSVVGVLASHPEDLQLFMEIINLAAEKQRPVKPLKDFHNLDVTRLKVGYFLSDGLFEPMPAVKRAVIESVGKLKSLGVQVTEFQPPNLAEAEEIFMSIMLADNGPLFTENLQNEKPVPQIAGNVMLGKMPSYARKVLRGALNVLGQKSMTRVMPYLNGKGEAFQNQMKQKQKAFREKYLKAMDNSPIGKLDAILSPVCALPAFLHNTADKVGLGGAYTIQYNVTGFPAGVATVSKVKKEEAVGRKVYADVLTKAASKIEESSIGLPLGVQIAGRLWEEDVVIALIEKLHRSDF